MDTGKRKSKKIFVFLKIGAFLTLVYFGANFFRTDESSGNFFQEDNKKIVLHYDGFEHPFVAKAKTVGEFFLENDIAVTEYDFSYPSAEEKIFPGAEIFLQKARKIEVLENGKEKEIWTLQKTVGEAVKEKSELKVSEDDIIKPDPASLAEDGMKVSITHVEVKEKTETELIAFKTAINEDNKLGWREKKVTQKGIKGKKETVYRVIYYDGKEISRKETSSKIVEEPVTETVTQGTYVKLGNADHTGLGTWYAQPIHLERKYPSISGYYAASPWLPMGSYAKVTNKVNGKSVIVRINDRGPFGPNRIIDLGKPAFSAIASLGAGIIDVKMEEIVN